MTNVKCIRCGVVNLVSNEVCKVCGVELRPVQTPLARPLLYPDHEPTADGDDRRRNIVTSIGPFHGVGDVLGPTISLMTKNFWLISKIVFVIVAPFEVFRSLSVGEATDDWQLTIGMYALAIMCNVLIAPALIYALMKKMQTGIAPGVNESYRWGLTKLAKLALSAAMSWAATVAGLFLLVIPGIILSLAFQLVYPMAVLEELSPVEVLKGSYELTKGHRLKIFGAGLLLALLLGVLSIPATGVAAFLALNGVVFWPINAAVGILVAIVGQSTTVLALVTYLSILRTLESRQSVIE